MPELEDLIMSQQVSDSPEETPEDRMRAALMQRLGVAPEVRAKQMSDQVLGQGGQGFSGLMNRIFGGAHEGLRVTNDPKYRGAYQEALASAMEQEKNLMPYARQLEMSGAMRDRAKMAAQEQERATRAKLYEALLKDAQVKFKNDTDRFKANAFILESKAKSDKLRAEGKHTEAKTLDQQVETEYLRRYGPGKPSEALQASFVKAGGFANATPEQFDNERNVLLNNKLLLGVAPSLMKPQSTGGGGSRTTEREQLVKNVGAFGQVIPTKEILKSTSTIAPKINYELTPEQKTIQQSIMQRLGAASASPQNPAPTAPQSATPTPSPLLPQAKKKPVLTPPPVGSATIPTQTAKKGPAPPAPPPDKAVVPKSPEELAEVQKALNRVNVQFPTAGSAKQAADLYNAANYAAELRSVLGESMEEMAPYMGAIKGSGIARTVRSIADALGLMPADSDPRKVKIENLLKKNETIDRVITTGKQMNMQEMKDIISYMPAQNQTYARAMTNALALDITLRMFLERLKRNDIQTPAISGNLTKYSENIYRAYQLAYKEKGEARARKLKQIENMFQPDRIWSAATGQ